jgi:dUTP pyrophosphatase
MVSVPIIRLDPELAIPTYAQTGDAGLDLRARTAATITPCGGRALVPTGIAIAIPHGFAGFVLPRSGNALHHGVGLANSPGLIDSAYRGEIMVVLLNTDPDAAFHVQRGDRIAQLVVQRVEQVDWIEVSSLEGFDGLDRGGGFGHTGRA